MPTVSFIRQSASLAILVALSLFARGLAAQIDTTPNNSVLHVFQSGTNDGYEPAGGVVLDAQGNLYGATSFGGNGGTNCFGGSCGTVYQLVPSAKAGGAWTENMLYNFTGVTNQQDGELPNGGLTMDAQDNLFGVTTYGGTGGCIVLGGVAGCGIVYEISPPSVPGGTWTKTTIYSFQGGADGQVPIGTLTFDGAGNLYGATSYGGGFGSCNAPFYQNCGTVFELSPPKVKGGAWTEKVLYAFKGYAGDVTSDGGDGANPNGGLILDQQGNIYGTTHIGGFVGRCINAVGNGCGTVFKLQPSSVSGVWTETVLHRFKADPDGASPLGGLVTDAAGNLCGATDAGGEGAGTIFRIAAVGGQAGLWKESVVFTLEGPAGFGPMASLALKDGILYASVSGGGIYGAGTILRLDPGSDHRLPNYRLLANFPVGNQAAQPQGTVTFDKNGTLYGTTLNYDHRVGGTVFSIANP